MAPALFQIRPAFLLGATPSRRCVAGNPEMLGLPNDCRHPWLTFPEHLPLLMRCAYETPHAAVKHARLHCPTRSRLHLYSLAVAFGPELLPSGGSPGLLADELGNPVRLCGAEFYLLYAYLLGACLGSASMKGILVVKQY